MCVCLNEGQEQRNGSLIIRGGDHSIEGDDDDDGEEERNPSFRSTRLLFPFISARLLALFLWIRRSQERMDVMPAVVRLHAIRKDTHDDDKGCCV